MKKATKQAIEAPRKSLFMMDPTQLVLIGHDTKDGPSHPRYDVRVHNTFDEAIVEGMMKYGCKKPISVIKVGDHLEVVDGRQRVINCREANRRLIEAGCLPLRVPVLPPEQGTDAKMAALMALLNTHKVDMTPFSLGQMAQGLFDQGYIEEEVAMLLKVSPGTVKNYVSLLGLKTEIQQMVVTGKIAASKGYDLARKDEKAQKAFLDRVEKGSRSGPPKRVPSKQALRKMVDEDQLDGMFLLGLRYALGDIDGLANLVIHMGHVIEKAKAKAEADAAAKPALRLVEGAS